MSFFQYSNIETDYLKKRDKKLAEVIERTGFIERKVNPDLFQALISSVISQQISRKAAWTIWGRFTEMFPTLMAEKIALATESDIQAIGMSKRKAGYIKSIAESVVEKHIEIENIKTLSDDEIVKTLTTLRGVGVWTAEMLMIFSLERPNVLSFGDLIIRKGLSVIHSIDSINNAAFIKYRNLYSPYCSVASFYIWKAGAEG